MPTIDELKEMEAPGTPLFLFDCVLPSGDTLRWSTHAVTLAGVAYPARVLSHNLFEMKSSAAEAAAGVLARVADSTAMPVDVSGRRGTAGRGGGRWGEGAILAILPVWVF